MHRYQGLVIILFGLVLLVRSDQSLKCYMCTSLTNEGCDTDPKAHDLKPVECTLTEMSNWQRNVQQHNVLHAISGIFEVDNLQHPAAPAKDMACAKMILKGANHDVTVRSCQIAKTENIDPCKAIQSKFTNDILRVDYCDLCLHDACNSSVAPSPRILFVLMSILGTAALAALYVA